MPFGAQGPPGGGRADSPQEWYMSLPLITRYWFSACAITTLLSAFGMLSPMTLLLDWNAVLFRFQIWRIFTNFCFLGKFGWPFIMNLIFMVQYSKTLEADFKGVSSDFLWLLLLGGSLIMGLNHVSGLGMPFLTIPLIFMTIWIWSRKHPNAQMSVFGLFNISSAHFPWFLICLTMLMGGSPVANLLGYFVGHVYWFLKEAYPPTQEHRFFYAPTALRNLVGDEAAAHTAAAGGAVRQGQNPRGGGGGGGATPNPWGQPRAAPPPPAGGGFRAFQGGGNRLGGD